MTTAETTVLTARSLADIATPQAARYMIQLCKHFAHRCPASHDGRTGHIAFAAGDCYLRAERDRLTIGLDAASIAELPQLKDVVVRHLVRFAFREELQIAWRDA